MCSLVSPFPSLWFIYVHDFSAPITVTICRRSPPSEYFWGYLFGAILEVPLRHTLNHRRSMPTKQVLIFSFLLKKIYTSWKAQITSPIVDALLNHGSLYYLTVISMLIFTVVSATTNVLFWPIMDSECVSFNFSEISAFRNSVN